MNYVPIIMGNRFAVIHLVDVSGISYNPADDCFYVSSFGNTDKIEFKWMREFNNSYNSRTNDDIVQLVIRRWDKVKSGGTSNDF
jgi:hypothetical protein